MLLTKENYFFKGNREATLAKVIPSVCEGQLVEGKVTRQSSQTS
jgi:hypothetical protein